MDVGGGAARGRGAEAKRTRGVAAEGEEGGGGVPAKRAWRGGMQEGGSGQGQGGGSSGASMEGTNKRGLAAAGLDDRAAGCDNRLKHAESERVDFFISEHEARFRNRQEEAEKLRRYLAEEKLKGVCRHDLAGEHLRSQLDPFQRQIQDRIAELGEGFVGRAWLAEALEAELSKHEAEPATSGSAAGSDVKASSSSSSAVAEAPYRSLPPAVVMYGDSGTGKSSFVCRVLDEKVCKKLGGSWERLNGRVLARHLCQFHNEDSLDPLEWSQALAGQIFLRAAEMGKKAEALASGGDHESRRDLVNWIRAQTSARRILENCVIPMLNVIGENQSKGRDGLGVRDIIWVDSLDEAMTRSVVGGTSGGKNNFTIVSLLIEFQKKWPPWVRIVATSRPDPDTKEQLQPLCGASIDVHSEQNRNDVRDFVVAKLERGFRLSSRGTYQRTNQWLSKILQCFELQEMMEEQDRDKLRRAPLCHGWRLWQPATVDAICAKAGGVFMYACEVLRQLSDNPRLDLNSLPDELAELYLKRYNSTFPGGDAADQFDEHSRPMLAMLVAAREPLPVDMVEKAQFLGDDGTTAAAAHRKTRWRRERKRHLGFVRSMCTGSLAEAGELQFSHKSFSDWLTGSAAASTKSKEDGDYTPKRVRED